MMFYINYTHFTINCRAVPNPCDEGALSVWVVQPGCPLDNSLLWQDPFSRYRVLPRAPTLVLSLRPTPGTDDATFVRPRGLADARKVWGPGFSLLAEPFYSTFG